MKRRGWKIILGLCILETILTYVVWRVARTSRDVVLVSMLPQILRKSDVLFDDNTMKQDEPRYPLYSEFQLLNDNITYVYAGYYDDRDWDALVKVTAMVPSNITYNFTCTVHYPDQSVAEVTGFVEYLYAAAISFYVKDTFRNGYIICPVSSAKGRPSYLTVGKQGISVLKTNVTVWPPPQKRNKLTRCVKPFQSNYSDASRLIWNIELCQILGIDKHIIYTDSQTQHIVDVLQSYVSDGIVEIRNFSVPQPHERFRKYMKHRFFWAEFLTYHDCLLSQMFSAKYVIFHDFDEVVIPRNHTTILEMADDLFAKYQHESKPVGGLIFQNVFFASFKNISREDFPQKDLALKYNIAPLLYTTRYKTSDKGVTPKSIILPKTVNVMFIHYVERFRQCWTDRYVDEETATLFHWRNGKAPYMQPPETEETFMFRFSDRLTSAVSERFKKVNLNISSDPSK